MKKMIFIGSAPGREHWASDCSRSLTVPHAIISMANNFELGKLRWIVENTMVDRFIFLQDSVVVRNEALLVSAFESDGSCCLHCGPCCFGCYLGLYERKTLLQVPIPQIDNKDDSIECESKWTKRYLAACEKLSHPIPWVSRDIFTVMRHGRENAVTITAAYDKYRGDWGQHAHNPSRDWDLFFEHEAR